MRHTAEADGDPFVSVAMNLEYYEFCRKFHVVCWPRLGTPSIILTYLDVKLMYVPCSAAIWKGFPLSARTRLHV